MESKKKFKEHRNLKVYEQSGYQYKSTPTIILKGNWLEQCGFDIGTAIIVKCEDGRLTITRDNDGLYGESIENLPVGNVAENI